MPDVPAAPQPAAAPVSEAELRDALMQFADGSHPSPHKMMAEPHAAGPFGPILSNIFKTVILPGLLAFLQGQFNITPKAPAA